MKNRISKILGLGLTLVLALALVAGFAVPVAASPGENEWELFDYPAAGADGDWFRDADIDAVGPMAEAINGDLYAYVQLGNDSTDHLFKSEDGGRSWAETEYADDTGGGAIVDMVCSSIDEDIIYVTDGNYVYKSTDAGDEFAFVAQDSLEEAVMGDCGIDIVDEPITSIDVGYDDDDRPFLFIGTVAHGGFLGSVYWMGEAGYPATWTDLKLSCYGAYDVYAVGCAPDFADSKETYVVVSSTGMASLEASVDATAEWSDTQAHNGGESAHLKTTGSVGTGNEARIVITMPSGTTLGDITEISWWRYALAGYPAHLDITLDVDGDGVVDPEDQLVAEMAYNNPFWAPEVGIGVGPTLWEDGGHIDDSFGDWFQTFETTDGDGFGAVDDDTLLWVGKMGGGYGTAPSGTLAQWKAGQVGNDPEGEMATTDISGDAPVVKLEIEIDNWVYQAETYIGGITINGVTYDLPAQTHVVSTIGVTCSWDEFAELFRDCDVGNPFSTQEASRIGFPDDWEDTETLFVGVTTPCDGGDVYSVTSGGAVDRNVAGIVTGCVGAVADTDIISLDICGDTDEAALIAGAWGDTSVYYSTDGGWDWDASAKNPTGVDRTYVLWYEDSALAATSGDECAVSLSCGDEVGEYWNQISLIATNITTVEDISHSPGYVVDSETLFMLTSGSIHTTQSLFRYDGTYWERVYFSTIAGADEDTAFEWVLVSPDFNDTNTVYVANTGFEVWRTQDAGCSWDKLTFPCVTRPTISAWVVIDEDTVITGGAGDDLVYKTTRHGARPWDEYDVATTGNVMSFDLEPGYEDPGTIILGDSLSQVFISEDGGEEWELVGDCADVLTGTDTSVVFDPTSDIIYAAAGDVIARCVIDWGEDWADQEWVNIDSSIDTTDDTYWGIVAAGDTALYVTDKAALAQTGDPAQWNGGVLRSLNPDAEDETEVVFERITEELTSGTNLRGLQLTTGSNVLWSLDSEVKTNVWTYEDTLATPVLLSMPVDGQKLGTTESATLSWQELDDATWYEVSLYRYCPECPDLKELITVVDTEEICITVNDLEPGSLYYWQVRVALGSPTLSKWSEERTFSTALVDVTTLCSPVCGGQDIILTPNFSWDKVDGATGYNIELATTETFTAGVIRGSSTVNAWVTAPLEYATTYYWRVRAVKDGVYSDWSVCIFTTMDRPEVLPPPVTVEQVPPPQITVEVPVQQIAPNWIYAIIGIGAALCVVVIVLIARTRRTPA